MTSVVVTYCRPRSGVTGEFTDSLANMLVHDARHKRYFSQKRGGGLISLTSGPDIASARDELARLVANSAGDWWLSLDADMAFAPDLCDRLVSAAHEKARPMVGAYCVAVPVNRPPYVPWHFFDPDRADALLAEGAPADALVEVDGYGMAATLIHRNVVVEMLSEYGGRPFTAEGLGEDLAWCTRVRAAGYPIHVATGVPVGHVKTHVYWPQEGQA